MAPSHRPAELISDDEDVIKQQLAPLFKNADAVDSFTDDDQEVPFAEFKTTNITIALPGFFEWLREYDPDHSRATVAAKVAAYRKAMADTRGRIVGNLRRIHASLAGKALFREIARGHDHDLTIRAKYSKRGGSDETPDDDDDSKNGAGTDATIRFGEATIGPNNITSRFPWMLGPSWQPDEVLFHEMVHAAADLNGATSQRRVNKGFDDEAEFMAITITNIYMSEKGQKQLLADHDDIGMDIKNPDQFLDFPGLHPRPRNIFDTFRGLQHTFFSDLAAIPPPRPRFNPIRQFNEELKARERARDAGKRGR
jgi:hypothetical protein